jgi:hypothetical protein
MINKFIIPLIFLLFSCKDSKITDSNNSNEIITRDLTISVLEELVLVETHLQSKYHMLVNYQDALTKSRDSILKSKNLNLTQFNKSFEFYAKSDKELIKVYEDMLNNLNEKSAKVSSTKN